MPETESSEKDIERMRCPDCGCAHLKTIRTSPIWGMVRRERKCERCGRRFYTREEIEPERRQESET